MPVPVSLSLGSSFLSHLTSYGTTPADALLSLTIAEYFRDEEGQDVLLFIDNIFRFTQGESVLSVLLRCSRTDVCPV